MEPIIDKLSEIETAASRIMESAVNETKNQDKEAEKRTAEFDAQVEAITKKKTGRTASQPSAGIRKRTGTHENRHGTYHVCHGTVLSGQSSKNN